MLESEGQAVASETTTTVAETTSAPESKGFVNPDGSFADGWTSGFEEEIKADKGLSTFKSVKDLARSYVNARKMIGKDKIAVPNEKSSPAEWEEYYKAGGRPETAADYKLEYPKDMPIPENENLRKSVVEYAHKAGLSQKQLAGLYELYNNAVKSEVVNMQQAEKLAKQEAIDSLKESWGKAYDQRIHFGNVALEKAVGDDQDLKARIVEKFGNDPDFIKFSSNLGNMFAEHKTISANIPTPADYQSQIDAIMDNPRYRNGTQAERMRLANQIVQLRELMAQK